MAQPQKRSSKLTKLGGVWETKNQTHCIKLGQENQTNPKYNRNIELVVKDDDGNVLSTHTNPFLTLLDPRNSKLITPEQASKIPTKLLFEVFVGDET